MANLSYTATKVDEKLTDANFDSEVVVDMQINDISDPTGAATPDFVSITRGGFTFSTQAYDGNATIEYKSYRVELSHDCDPAAGYEVHFRGTPTTDGTGDVRMLLEYALQKKAGNVVTGSSKAVVKTIVAGGNTAGTEYYFSFPILPSDTGLLTMERGDSIWFNIKREPANVADTYGADFAQIEFGVHGFIDSLGEDGFDLTP